ncbi:sulfatase-like hydrolase/transferase [Ruficoccus amylovorans]|uniref:Sulfatase-like hydrolase/transferase n=1 Tax=Ruficoccus amylovorans TaxID=1804625 RepID=A0A842HKB1_9BACT|nr:sulfatase-like hydrolase/transferase [Ruficoccus amylovorans]MBC2595917.1 sulfatase-like hydrolase/transferase [Ruficoccus amylovorans]
MNSSPSFPPPCGNWIPGLLKLACTVLPVTLAGVACAQPAADSKPNILWLTSEDNEVTWIGCYGNPFAKTPNIDQLAKEGFRYTKAYANAPVCAPSRSGWITGVHALSLGTFPMRSRYEIPHEQIPYYPDQLRKAGYYCANYTKTDYNIAGRLDEDCWDDSKPEGWVPNTPFSQPEWETLKQHQPFFQVVNFLDSHESRAQGDVESTLHSPADTDLPAYHPDLPAIRKNYAKYYDAVERMDDQVGQVLKKLEESGMADDTIVIYNSDHGGVMPRSKRFLYESGLHCPLVIRIPEKYKSLWPADAPGSPVERLVSFIDMPKTWLSLAGADIPPVMQGRVFLGPGEEQPREYHFAYRGRMGERIDNTRAVTDGRYLYIKNYMPAVPNGQHLDYLWRMVATRAWEDYFLAGKADSVTGRFFRPKGDAEELYDLQSDPDNIHNLIGNGACVGEAERMRQALRQWQLDIHDTGLLPESEMVRLSAGHGLTIYEWARDSGAYNLPAYLDAADRALSANPENLSAMVADIDSEDVGLRYWAVSGCLLLGENALPAREQLLEALDDDSHEVRAVAAWALFGLGEQDAAADCLSRLLQEKSYASLSVLNIVDWVGKDAAAVYPQIKALQPSTDDRHLQSISAHILASGGE